MTNNDELAQLKQLATFMTERFSMNPVSCKILNEDWKKRFPDDSAVAETLVALLAERDADKKRIAELEALTAEQDKRLVSYAAIATKNASEARTVSVKLPVVPSQYETLKLCLEPSDGYGMQKGAEYMRDEFIKALAAAGIKLELGE